MELYCTSALTNALGVIARFTREPTRLVLKEPPGRSTLLKDTVGSTASRGEICSRPREILTVVRVPP